jgi:carbon monoxide dehydrogenase subunit G
MPDLQKLTVKGPDDFIAVVRAGVSFIKGDFEIYFRILEKDPPNHVKMTGHGAGLGSTNDIDTVMELEDAEDKGTNMKWKANANVGGKIASVGKRLLDAQAEKMINQLFKCIQHQLN